MEIPYGYCQCGCGEKTRIAHRTATEKRWKKGEPLKYLPYHHIIHFGQDRFNSHGYTLVYMPDHPRANRRGLVFEHILIAERALGKHIPKRVDVHHFPSKENWTHLVICENHSYHFLLHVRHRALIACGNPNWRKCPHCQQYDSQENLYFHPHGLGHRHRECFNEYSRNYYHKIKNAEITSPFF